MRALVMMGCVLAIAVGGGLIAFGSKLEPQLNFADPAMMSQIFNSHQNREEHMIAATAFGVGMGLMVLGTFGLIIPWVNTLLASISGELTDNSARTIATVTLWLCLAMIMIFGVFRMHWSGATGMSVLLIVVVVLCAVTTACTAMIFGWKPWVQAGRLSNHTEI